ncbi:LamG-like jellyroll fold domain-containing protein [uncultured Lacinutrix sp.]|uniref:LamG-like jellyroll fold domain-containing protein n=1 Tax=uncultured Lacinutrix sp. TaxID=574032 RepID=UPI00261EFBFB|nr:LamG-like jellyroll fold domain-containing protein [uncultured Lacinutrix sp.]
MKQFYFTFFAVLFFGMVSAQTFQEGGVNYYVISAANSTVGVVSSADFEGALIVPPTVNNASVDYTVIAILDSAFENSTTLTSIEIPNTVTFISNGAFRFCTNLTSVIIPNSVTSIGQLAFGACTSLTSVVIPDSVTSIGIEGFAACSGLTSLTISSSLTSLSVGVFGGCTSLTSLNIPNSVTSIGQDAIRACSSLTSVTIPSSVTSISNTVFQDCANLNAVTVNWESPLSINANVFYNVNVGNATLYVPVGAEALYQSEPVWQNFGTIGQPQAGSHLDFGNSNDYVDCGNNPSLEITGNTITLEAYVKFNSFGAAHWLGNIINKASPDASGYMLRAGGNGAVNFVVANFGWHELTTADNTITLDTWFHIAGVYNGTTSKIYVDGIEVASTSIAMGNIGESAFNVNLGRDPQDTGRGLDASLDEVRIWNIARNETQIITSKNCELQGDETGLVAYYKFNQGIDAADNTSETTVIDVTGINNATLTNFTLSGTTSNWLAGSPVTTGSIIPSEATVTTPVTYTQGDTASPLTATTGSNGTGLMWYTSETGGSGLSTAPSPSTATIGTTSYWVSSTNDNGCESERIEIVVNVYAPATHLNFDGSNNYIELANEANFDFTTEMTVEVWVNSNVLPQQWDALVVKGDDSWRLHLNDSGTVNFTCSGVTSTQEINSTTNINDGNWHHIAATLGGNAIKIYIDGILETQATASGIINNNAQTVLIGNNPIYPDRFFTGNMDDIRIWSVAKTANQINAGKNCELQGNETGLVAYYNFNQGIDAADNTSETILLDATANANNGTLTNFALTGTTSNWLAGSPVITGSIIPSEATVTTPVTYTQGDTASQLAATTGSNGTGLMWYTTEIGGMGDVNAPTPDTFTVGSTSYWVTSTNNNGCESERSEIVVSIEETLGVNNNSELSNITIYPNPSSSLLNISNLDGIELQLSIYDINGRLLLNKACNKEINTIDISSFSNGMYLLKMKTDFGEVTKRVIKD